MLQSLFSTLGRVYNFIIALVFTALLCVVTWGFWQYYQDVRLQKKFVQEGQLLSVPVIQADHQQRSWRDVFGNTVYLTIHYQHKEYMTRFVMDSSYVGSGDRVQLLYHSGYDAFKQPRQDIRFHRQERQSRLVEWSSLAAFGNETLLLLLCLTLMTFSFFLISGLINTVLPVPFLQTIAGLVATGLLIIASVYFTYDTYQYFQYYERLKAEGQATTVRVLATDRELYWRTSHGGRHRSYFDPMYRYQATVQDRKQERIVVISESDFETLKPGDTLKMVYAKSLDDLMPVTYPPDYRLLFGPLAFWFVTLIVLRISFTKQQKKRPSVS